MCRIFCRLVSQSRAVFNLVNGTTNFMAIEPSILNPRSNDAGWSMHIHTPPPRVNITQYFLPFTRASILLDKAKTNNKPSALRYFQASCNVRRDIFQIATLQTPWKITLSSVSTLVVPTVWRGAFGGEKSHQITCRDEDSAEFRIASIAEISPMQREIRSLWVALLLLDAKLDAKYCLIKNWRFSKG